MSPRLLGNTRSTGSDGVFTMSWSWVDIVARLVGSLPPPRDVGIGGPLVARGALTKRGSEIVRESCSSQQFDNYTKLCSIIRRTLLLALRCREPPGRPRGYKCNSVGIGVYYNRKVGNFTYRQIILDPTPHPPSYQDPVPISYTR